MKETNYTSLRDYMEVIRRQWLIVLAIPLVFVAVTYAFSQSQQKKYESEAAVKFQDASNDLDPIGAGLIARMLPEERATQGAETVKDSEIQVAVQKKIGPLTDVSISARAEARSNFVVIRATAPTPRRALVVADAFAQVTHDRLRADYRAELRRQVAVRRRDSARLRKGLDQQGVSRQIELDGRLRVLMRLGEPVKIVREASFDPDPVAPKPVRNSLLALVVGLTIALLVAFTRESLDRRLRTSKDITESVDLPLLTRIRGETLGKTSIAELTRGTEAEALGLEETRILRTNLDFMDVDRHVSKVVVTSAVAGEGKSTVAASLAVASALAGRRTLLVECDLRRPVLAERLGLKAAPGLADLVAGHATSADALQEIDLGASAKTSVNGAGAGTVETGSLTVLTAGTTAPKPSELLGSRSFVDYLSALSRAYDITILDTTPLLPVVDTLALIPLADRLVLCVRARQTTREQLKAARDVIDRLPHPPAGVVVTDVRRGDDLDYGYYSPYAGTPASSA